MQNVPLPVNQWEESDSKLFLNFAETFVPARTEQTQTLLQLIPATPDEEFLIVELASGEGKLAEAILERFPHCHYLALDGSETMRTTTQQRLERFQDRLEVQTFTLEEQSWRTGLSSQVRCVLSSLCIHHLDGAGKRQLFRDMLKHLEPGGTLLVADIILPANQRVANLFAQQYDEIVREQSMALSGDLSGYDAFEKLRWNFFRYDYGKPDLYDKPSLLEEQLRWLREVNFRQVDCYWMRAGHAVYGGYR